MLLYSPAGIRIPPLQLPPPVSGHARSLSTFQDQDSMRWWCFCECSEKGPNLSCLCCPYPRDFAYMDRGRWTARRLVFMHRWWGERVAYLDYVSIWCGYVVVHLQNFVLFWRMSALSSSLSMWHFSVWFCILFYLVY